MTHNLDFTELLQKSIKEKNPLAVAKTTVTAQQKQTTNRGERI